MDTTDSLGIVLVFRKLGWTKVLFWKSEYLLQSEDQIHRPTYLEKILEGFLQFCSLIGLIGSNLSMVPRLLLVFQWGGFVQGSGGADP